jgi:hypothetical protein
LAKDEHRDPADFDDTGDSHAADEPTAVWDMETLRKAGLGDLANLPEGPDAAPATPAVGMSRPSMIVDEQAEAAAKAAAAAQAAAASRDNSAPNAQPAQSGSWWSLVAMAIALGAAAYFVIRALR